MYLFIADRTADVHVDQDQSNIFFVSPQSIVRYFLEDVFDLIIYNAYNNWIETKFI